MYASCLLGSIRTASKGEPCCLCVIMCDRIFMLLPCHRFHNHAYIFAEVIINWSKRVLVRDAVAIYGSAEEMFGGIR